MGHTHLLFLHGILRWLVVAALLGIVLRSFFGWRRGSAYTRVDHVLRSTVSSLGHLQLVVGLVLYGVSPLIGHVFREGIGDSPDLRFFALLHPLLMLIALVLLTIGTAKARRCTTDHDRFRTTFLWCMSALLLIVAAIPWPGSPLAQRPLLRTP